MDEYNEALDAEDTYSWRGILITIALATAAAAIFFLRQRSTRKGWDGNSQSTGYSDEDRRKKREHLAKIAEERAAALRRLEDTNNVVVSDGSKIDKTVDCNGKKVGAATAKKHVNILTRDEKAKIRSPTAEDVDEHQKKDGKGGRKVENVSVSAASMRPSDQTMTCNYTKQEERDTAIAIDIEVDGVDEAEKHSNQNVVDEEVKDENDDSVDENVGADVDGQAHLEVAESDTQSHRDRHAQALAKIMAKKEEPEPNQSGGKKQEEATNRMLEEEKQMINGAECLTIFLLLTSSPGSPRVELSIPTDVTAARLRHLVSDASGVPNAEMKLIFRGRMITEQMNEMLVVDEFAIQNESALHVVGKPRQSTKDADDNGAAAEGDESSESEEDESSQSEEEVLSSTDNEYRAELVEAIRSSSGSAIYHRAAATGNLDVLQRAVASGFSDLLHVPDTNGWTPLHEAVRAGQTDIVYYLAEEAGLDVNQVTQQGSGLTPLSLALENHGSDHPLTRMLQTLVQESNDLTAESEEEQDADDMYD